MRAIGYFRQAPGQRGDSLAQQQRAFLDFCEAQGYEVAATFSEDAAGDVSSAFGQLIEHLKRPEKGFVVVVAQAPRTLAEDAGLAAARFLQVESLGAQVQFIKAKGDALGAIVESWSSAASSGLSEKVRAAMRRKAIRGEALGRPPYGYKVGARRRLELVPDEAVVVRYIFRLYLQEGLGIRLIARRLNEEGLRTRRNRPWSMVSIRDILRNRAYLGTYQRLGVRVPGTHPALVSPEHFRSVQERLSARRTNYSPRTTKPFLLSGLVVCADCGNRMIGVSRRQSWKRRKEGDERSAVYRYYQCESRTNQSICEYNTRRAEELEEEVRRRLADADARTPAAGDDAAVLAEWAATAARLRERLQQIDRRIARSLEAAAAARISRERLRSQGIALAQERLKAEDDLKAAQWRAEHYASATERRRARDAAVERLSTSWHSIPLSEHQDLLREVVDHVVAADNGARLVLRP